MVTFLLRLKQKEPQHSDLNIKRHMDNVGDVVRQLIIIKKKLVLVVVFQQQL